MLVNIKKMQIYYISGMLINLFIHAGEHEQNKKVIK